MDVTIVGGTGAEGFGLALRLLGAGHRVTIGSRSADRAGEAVERTRQALGTEVEVVGAENASSVVGAEVVAVTVPFAGMIEIYASIGPALRSGQVVLDTTSPLMTAVGGKPWEAIRPWQGSAGELAAAHVPPGVAVVSGFHTIGAHALADLDHELDSDTLLCSDDEGAKRLVGELVESVAGMRWVDAGPLENARLIESLTPLVITINRRYKVRDGGFRITGRDAWGAPR
ncbi:MAG: NADPH-dependent F420 reductase [Actinomycetota bacterium]